MGNSGSKTRDVFTKTVARVQIAAPSRVHRAAIMLCGETLCGDKFLFSFPLTKCQCALTIVCENRLFALTLVSIRSGGKENNSRNSTLIGCPLWPCSYPFIYQQKKLHGHIEIPNPIQKF